MKLNKLVSTLEMPHEEWLRYRKKGIGGSDAGAICGVNKYRSAVSVFLDKTTEQTSEFDNEAMRQGRDLEQYVAERFCEETGKKVRRANAIFSHSELPFMLANVDRLVVGENAGLECKTASAFSADKWADGSIPPEYEVQCNHYMAVTGADAWYIACVILGKEFIWHRIERDEELIATIEELEKDFWENNVVANVMPAPDGSPSVDSYINSRYADSDPEQFVDITTYDGALKRREEITVLEKKLGAEKKQIEQEVKQYMQEAETAYSNSYEVKWKTVESKRVDTKKLKSEYPKVYKDCINVGKKKENSNMKTIASNAKSAGKSLKGMQSSVKVTSAGLDAIGSKAKSAMNKLANAFSNTASKAKSSGKKVGTGFTQGMQSNLNKAPTIASSAVSKVNAKLRAGRSGAHAAGAYISQGFAQGMSSCLGQIEAAASRMVAAADKAIRAKAKIHSPSKMTEKDGKYMGLGTAKGLVGSITDVKKASEKLVKATIQTIKKKKTNVYAKAIKSKVSPGIKAGLKNMKKKTKSLLSSSKTTLLKANKNRKYEDMASKAIDKYKTTINKKVSSTTKSLKKKVDAVTKSYQKKYKKNAKLKKAYTNAGKRLKEKITKKIKAQGNAAIKAVDATLTTLGKKYQKKYDAIADARSNFLSKMSDYGDLFKSDDYGFISLVDFKSQTNQINALAKNMEHLKKVLPYNMMKDIQALDTAQGLKYTNELLKKGDTWLKQYGKDYTNFIATAKKNANTYYQPYITKLDTEYVNAVTKAIKDLQKKMNAIGTQASKGLVKGVSNKKNTKKVKKASNKLASTVPKTAKKKLKVHSPSRVMDKIAYYTGIGFVNRLEAMRKNVQSAMQGIVDVPAQMAPAFAGNFNGELSSDYEYYTKAEYTVNVPLEINGKEFARATAQDTMVEQNRLQRRNNRKNGKV